MHQSTQVSFLQNDDTMMTPTYTDFILITLLGENNETSFLTINNSRKNCRHIIYKLMRNPHHCFSTSLTTVRCSPTVSL